VQVAGLKDAFALIWILVLLVSQVPVVRAQETIPQAVRAYALPGETIQTIPPIHYGDHIYCVYFFVRGSLDDRYGASLHRDDPDYLEEQGIEALLLTRDNQVVADEETIRWVYLLARTSYKRTEYKEARARVEFIDPRFKSLPFCQV
jgi:hypothetical protein